MLQKQAKWFKADKANGKMKCNSSNKKYSYYFKQELNGIISKGLKDSLRKACCCQVDSNKEGPNDIDKFDALLVSSSDKDKKGPSKREAVMWMMMLMMPMMM
eukprot:7539101-Ditylum_brightwellii.AAC.1